MQDAKAVLVGRSDELRELDDGIETAAASAGRLFVLLGEPGIGKTRLADEVAGRAKACGFAVHWGRCWEVGGAPAFWPWIQIFRSLGRDPATEKVVTAYGDVLARLLPELRGGDDVTRELENAQARFRLFDELWALLRATTEQIPLMLVLDDLHAADPSSAALLRLVVRELRHTRLLIVATCRDREAKPEPAVTEAIRAISREGASIDLRRLDIEEVGAFLAARAGHDVPQALAARVQASTDGNPLFVDQVCRLLTTRRGFDSPSGEVPIPAGLRDAIRGRLGAFAAPARGALEVAAVLGRDFTIPLVAFVSATSESEVASWIAQGIEAGLLQEIGLAQYEICHALFRETLYRDLPSGRRAELHARAAEGLEAATVPERGLGEVARHLLAALSVVGGPRVLEGCLRASRRALDALAFEDAASILTLALDQVGGSVDEMARAEALVLLAEAHARVGEPELSLRACDEAAAIARTRSDPELLARAALALGAELIPGRIVAPLITILKEARETLPKASSRLRACVLARLGAALQPAADPEVPIAMAREAVAMARALGDPQTLRTVLHQAGSALVDFGDPSERIGWDSELLQLSERDHDAASALRACVRLFFDHIELGEPIQADRYLEMHSENADRLGVPDYQWRTLTMRALRALWGGRFDDAETYRAQARRIASRARIPEAPSTELLQGIGLAVARWEELPRLEEVFTRMRAFPAADDVESAIRAFVAARRGDVDTARALVARIPEGSIFFKGIHPGTRFIVDVAAWTGDAVLAERLFARLLPLSSRFFSWGRIGMTAEGPTTWLLGSLATTIGRLDEAERYLEDALARTTAAGMPVYEAVSCLEYARLLRARGSAASGRRVEITKRGAALAESLGITALALRFAQGSTTSNGPAEVTARIASSAPAAAERTAPSLVEMTKDGELWALQWQGRTVRLKDSRGMQLLAQLIASPAREFHVLSLVGSEGADGGDAGEVLDKKAQQAYRDRAEDLRDQIREAESFGDATRLGILREELDRLGDELARAVGLGGRSRRAGAAAEKARINVQKRLREAIRRVADQDKALGRQLERSVRTGTFCAYEPE